MTKSRLTLMEEALIEFEKHLRANGGRLKPLTAEELAQEVPPPPDVNAAVQLRAMQRRVDNERKRTRE